MQKPSTTDIDPVIYLAIELSDSTWLVVSKIPTSEKTGLHRMEAGDSQAMLTLICRWRGGQHSQLRVRKPKAGEHGCRTSEEALAVIRTMASRWSDENTAASLNRMGMRTGQGMTWTAYRVGSLLRVRGIPAYRPAEKNGEWVTMSEAAKLLGVSHHAIPPHQRWPPRCRASRA